MVGLEEYAQRYPRLTDAVIVLALLGGAVIGANLVGPGESRPQEVWVANVVTGIADLARVPDHSGRTDQRPQARRGRGTVAGRIPP